MKIENRRGYLVAVCLAAAALFAPVLPAQPQVKEETYAFDIPVQELGAALRAFASVSRQQITFEDRAVQGKRNTPLQGTFTAHEALEKLLHGSGLSVKKGQSGLFIVRPQTAGARTPDGNLQLVRLDMDADSRLSAQSQPDAESAGIPELLVKGARTSNTDIRRTEDDVQPYVVFGSEEIEESMATNLETFLRTHLPMNQSRFSEGQDLDGMRGNQSTVDLRGLGADETLILVNGRRLPGVAVDTDFAQGDINGIALSSVERIEVLPSTAGGIYGGGATGGVVNIILKRDYPDLRLTAGYDGSFAGGGARRRLDAAMGFKLEGGRTSVNLTASYNDGKPLYIGDRDFTERARALQDRNDHESIIYSDMPLHGYTTNIMSASGEPLVLKDGMRSLNSHVAHVPVGYAGPGTDNGAAFLGTADRYSLAPANDILGGRYSLLNTPTVTSFQLNLRREFTGHIEAFVDASRYDNRSVRVGGSQLRRQASVVLPEGPDNPFTEEVLLSVPMAGYDASRLRDHSRSLNEQLSAGVIVRLPRKWTVQGEYSLGRSNYLLQFPAEGGVLTEEGSEALINGQLDPLRDVNAYPLDFSPYYPTDSGRFTSESPGEESNATLRISGPLLTLPGGALRLAALLERREQLTGDRVQIEYPAGEDEPFFIYNPETGSSTDSGYAELNAPLVSRANARPGLRGLDLRASYRHDTIETRTRPYGEGFVVVPSPDGPFPEVPYQVHSTTANQFTLGFRYTPVENVALRVSYGRGILPPKPSQLSELVRSANSLNRYLDPKRGGLPVSVASIERYSVLGNLNLRPEQSKSWSGGVILTPAAVPGLRLSVDYTRIEKTDEIGSLTPQALLDLEDFLPGIIVRNELTPADAALNYTGGTIRTFNGGKLNIARSLMEAFDIQASYRWTTRFGGFSANARATVQPTLSQQAALEGDAINAVSYANGPLKVRANAGLRWGSDDLNVGWNLQYYDASFVYTSTATQFIRYVTALGQGSALIPSQTYHDLNFRYRIEAAPGVLGGLLANTDLQLSVQNVLNTSPPILASPASYAVGGYATEGDPRLRRYSISFTRTF